MKAINANPIATLCCEMNPLMAAGKQIVYEAVDDRYSYLMTPVKCHYCEQQICESCWKSGKHFVKNFTIDKNGKGLFGIGELKIVRDIPQCVNPWVIVLGKVKAHI